MNALFILFVAESFVFALMWHNKLPRSEKAHESERPDRAVLFTHQRISEAHAVRTANAAFGQSGPSSRQGNHSRASVRFRTTATVPRIK